MTLIRRYIRAYAHSLYLIAACSAISAGVAMLLLGFLNSTAVAGTQTSWSIALAQGVALLFAAVVSRGVAAAAVSRFGSGLVAELRRDLSNRFMALDFERLLNQKHAVFGALIEDLSRLAMVIQLAPMLLANSVLAVAGLVYMTWLSPTLTAVAIPFVGLTGLLFGFTRRRTEKAFDEVRAADDALFSLFRTLVDGKRELVLSPARAGHFTRAELRPAIERARQAQFTTAWRWGFSDALGESLGYGWVLAAILAGRYAFDVRPEVILQFVVAGMFISGPLTSLFHLGAQLARAAASLRHMERIGLDVGLATSDVTEGRDATFGHWRTLAMERVVYTYADGADSGFGFGFGPLDLTITRGETVFVTGGNGSGKSTLLLLLAGLLQPKSGKLFVDGRPLQSTEIQDWRRLFTGVFFDFTLFRQPIAPTGDTANAKQVTHWLQRVQLHTKVEVRDGLLSTIDLSQGQRKRLALVQACLDDRDVMVFDEFTADQDKDFRERFYNELLPELKSAGKTLLVVSHDDRYWHLADRVLKLDHGQVSQHSFGRGAERVTAT